MSESENKNSESLKAVLLTDPGRQIGTQHFEGGTVAAQPKRRDLIRRAPPLQNDVDGAVGDRVGEALDRRKRGHGERIEGGNLVPGADAPQRWAPALESGVEQCPKVLILLCCALRAEQGALASSTNRVGVSGEPSSPRLR
ncbi:MAG TPA: hypothetical protein VLL82_01335 [Mycobacterium sp.]|nr:hypothetical protein [Mycobacterium sp.]